MRTHCSMVVPVLASSTVAYPSPSTRVDHPSGGAATNGFGHAVAEANSVFGVAGASMPAARFEIDQLTIARNDTAASPNGTLCIIELYDIDAAAWRAYLSFLTNAVTHARQVSYEIGLKVRPEDRIGAFRVTGGTRGTGGSNNACVVLSYALL